MSHCCYFSRTEFVGLDYIRVAGDQDPAAAGAARCVQVTTQKQKHSLKDVALENMKTWFPERPVRIVFLVPAQDFDAFRGTPNFGRNSSLRLGEYLTLLRIGNSVSLVSKMVRIFFLYEI
eukprot:gb/GECG01001789.1/.p1 GENE.gb/GECG01001789.1/~~gb/GECG01001789.1/.p1  ORF type:complete len:120 (+),score=9.87 gb/GECG01001789.1/:1-360(+)